MHSLRRATLLLAAGAPLALSTACSEPDLTSELNTEGPPEVVEVNVINETSFFADPTGGLLLGEWATFCIQGDQYDVNTFYCPLERDATNAPMPGKRISVEVGDAIAYGPALGFTDIWHARIIFDELLDPDIEELIVDDTGATFGTLENTQPATLTCNGTAVPYDGFYDPSGNHLSYPPGPALVIQPSVFVATGSSCEVSLKDGAVTDKDGNSVASGQNGPYGFTLAPLQVYGSAPADTEEGVAIECEDDAGAPVACPIEVDFSAPIDDTTVAGIAVAEDGGGAVAGTLEVVDSVVLFTPTAMLAPETTYTITVTGPITDVEGGAIVLFDADGNPTDTMVITFTTGPAA